ncbi:PGRC2 protein, partial [Piaya cayana]|nr:PGRC2 protein [Piaya cayana]
AADPGGGAGPGGAGGQWEARRRRGACARVGRALAWLLGAYRLYARWAARGGCGAAGRQSPAAALPRMKRRDFTLEQLREFDGVRDPRILLAVNGKVFDVSKGSKFYGPDGPYGIFGGRDASRGLATFCLDKDALRDEYDDLSDLNAVQMESVREWEMQFKEKYDYVGRLLKPGEEPSEYTDEEDTKDHTKQE